MNINDATYSGFLSYYNNYGITVDDDTVAVWDTPMSYDIWINVAGDETYSSHAEANFTFVLKMS